MSPRDPLARPAVDLSSLESLLTPGALVTEVDVLPNYRWGFTPDPDAGMPFAVVLASTVQDVQAGVRFAAAHRIPIVPRGAGSGLSGGSSAVDGCLVISMERMRAIEVDPVACVAVVEAGVLTAEVKHASAVHGLWYPPDPSSSRYCSIGGNVATNAGGLCCVKYGVTTDYVLGLTVVLASGEVVEMGGNLLKDVAGLPLLKLFVGSEGTLGIITRIVLRLVPAPRTPSTLVAMFRSLDDATSSILDITQRIQPSMLEFMDQVAINAIEDVCQMGLDRDAEAMLIIQSDEPPVHAAWEIEEMCQICKRNDASKLFSTKDLDTGDTFVEARRMAISAVERERSSLIQDVGVPLIRLGDLLRGIKKIADNRKVKIAVVAHAGDGNTHPVIVFDACDADQSARAHSAYGDVMMLAISLGGTITGEHGVGRHKLPWLSKYLSPEALALNHVIKNALDPLGIMNPGTLFYPRQ